MNEQEYNRFCQWQFENKDYLKTIWNNLRQEYKEFFYELHPADHGFDSFCFEVWFEV